MTRPESTTTQRTSSCAPSVLPLNVLKGHDLTSARAQGCACGISSSLVLSCLTLPIVRCHGCVCAPMECGALWGSVEKCSEWAL
jgi:hypothetical protein